MLTGATTNDKSAAAPVSQENYHNLHRVIRATTEAPQTPPAPCSSTLRTNQQQ